MYFLFRELYWEPSRYYSMERSEKIVTRAFVSQLVKERQEELEKIERMKHK